MQQIVANAVEKNYVCDIAFTQALARARQLDLEGPDKYTLFCIPFAAKNSMNVRGLLNDFGFLRYIKDRATFSTDVVAALEE